MGPSKRALPLIGSNPSPGLLVSLMRPPRGPHHRGMPRRDLSRRQFLARSAGLAGASLGIQVRAGEGNAGAAPGEPVRLAIVGAGDRGTQLLGAVLRIPGVRIAAIADPDPARLRRAADIAHEHAPLLTTDSGVALERSSADAVLIASPVHLHRDHAVGALEAGKHVYLEKPMALNAVDSRAVLAAAEEGERRGQVFQVGFQRRYNPRYLSSIALIRSGQAGRVLFVRAQWHSTGTPSRTGKSWFFRREKSGDIVLEQACHQMDVFNWVFGAPPERACGLGGTSLLDDLPGRDIRDHYGLSLQYPGGGMVHFSHLSYAIPDRRFAGVYELVFGQRLGVDLANAIAWDR